jgi:hypothetical protein
VVLCMFEAMEACGIVGGVETVLSVMRDGWSTMFFDRTTYFSARLPELFNS